ncbi:MAG TPA: metalloregulator ArsR/SmtB family transcription factor [bacterium]
MKHRRDLQAEIANALAHPLRIKILEKLRGGPCCVCRIIPHVGAEQSNVSHHLSILKNAGIVRSQKKGMEVWYEVSDRRIFKILDLINELLAGQMQQNNELLSELLKTE